MTARWNEASQSEDPAVDLLVALGYTYLPPEHLERETYREVLLLPRLRAALQRLNPWLSEENLHRAVRALSDLRGASLLETSEKVHTALAFGVTVEQDRGEGKRSHSVRFFDFEAPRTNDLLVTRQLRVQGVKQQIVPDVVVFANGIPLAVIECKNPTLGDAWLQDAVEQLDRYQEQSECYRGLGAPELFPTVQVLIAACGQNARYGTVGTPYRHFAAWKLRDAAEQRELARYVEREPSPQDALLFALLLPERLLEILRTFVVFERDAASGRAVRKLCRYQQFDAVRKAALRARRAATPVERGGVVWHTQGSGKSLTMLWLALALKRDPVHENPTLVLVTDRKELDEQIGRVFRACGFPNPESAGSVRELRELLRAGAGRTILTTVQKFQELEQERASESSEPLVLNRTANLFVLVDEAHRTQYGSLAANLRAALPNAAFFAFTGTPIDKRDRSTLSTFGPYVDTYTIEQAVADGATVPIFYESRLPALQVIGATLDQLFERVFADRSAEERAAIQARFATEQALASAPRRLETIALDLIAHFTGFIQPNRKKALVVACSRDAAVSYQELLERLQAPPSAAVISTSNDDDLRMRRHGLDSTQRKALLKRFLDPEDPLQILVVCDMLLTGFDAPVLQVLYLDSPLREHTLLQAIARVNRTDTHKTYGLIVDYWGVSTALQEALAIFAPQDVQGALQPKTNELPRLQARHAAAMKFFAHLKNRGDLEAHVRVLEPEDVRADFDVAFRRFAESLELVLPDPAGLPYRRDCAWLGEIRQAARARYRDQSLDISDCGAKVRELIAEAISATGVEILVKEVSILAKEFDEKLAALADPEAKASEMEHALKAEIHVRLEEDPAFYGSLRERLQQLIEAQRAKRLDAAQALAELKKLRAEASSRTAIAQDLGLSPTGFAIFNLLHPRDTTQVAETDQRAIDLAALLERAIEHQLDIVDWQQKDDVQREMRRDLKRCLNVAGIPKERHDALAIQIVDLLKAQRKA
jgi:type I restriction enzyme R subunit